MRIAPEVHIQSQREAYGPHPGKRRRYALKADLLNLIPEKAQGIRKKDLHSKSEHKKEQAVVESLYGYSSLPLLKSHVVPAHDRALGHLGEHGKIDHRVYDIRAPCDLPPEKIGLVRDHLKEIETEAEREHDLVRKPGQNLKEDERTSVDRDRGVKRPFVGRLYSAFVG